MPSKNQTSLLFMTPLVLICIFSLAVFGPIIYGVTAGTMPSESVEKTYLKFEKVENPETVDVKEEELNKTIIKRFDTAIDEDEKVYIDNKVPQFIDNGDIYRHGDSYYRIDFETKRFEKYPIVGFIDNIPLTMSFMSVSVFSGIYGTVNSIYYVVSVLVNGQSWDYETEDKVFYSLLMGVMFTIITVLILII